MTARRTRPAFPDEGGVGRVVISGPLMDHGAAIPALDVEAVIAPTTDGRWAVDVIDNTRRRTRFKAGQRRFDSAVEAVAYGLDIVSFVVRQAVNCRAPRGTATPVKVPGNPAD